MPTKHTCILGDARRMAQVADSSVQLVVTSPPYWQLKDYGPAEQIGFNDTYEQYINYLNLVWQECHRALSPGCRLVVNIGDQFARAALYGRYKVIPIRTEIIRFCETIGFDYMGAIIWQKKTTLNTTGGASVMGSYPFPRNGIVEIDYEFILIFKKPGRTPARDSESKHRSSIPKEKWREYFSGHWALGGVKQDKHLAMFPVELPKRTIEMFTFVGETVLDPFLGSGTTALAARLTDRNSIGYEINVAFQKQIAAKLGSVAGSDQYRLKFVRQKKGKTSLEAEIARLPYICSTTQTVVRSNGTAEFYGSKTTVSDLTRATAREVYFTVAEIVAPNLLKLKDNQVVRLLGVLPLSENAEMAIEFLTRKTLGRKVYLKFDEVTKDKQGQTLAYVYLKNRTFVNAHLIKQGLAKVDGEFPCREAARFEKLRAIVLSGINPSRT